jgi:multidrug efflux pump
MLSDLQNSVLTAVILVFIVILYFLGIRSSILIGLAIPTSFLMGILALSLAGLHGQYRRAVQPDPGRRHAGR